MLYNDRLSLYPMSFVNPNMYTNMFQCCISDMNRNREILTSKINCLNDITYYADNIPVASLNEDEITIIHDQPKNKLTIYDLNQLIFPFDPIRDWVKKEVKRINEKYAWAEEIFGRRALEGRKVYE